MVFNNSEKKCVDSDDVIIVKRIEEENVLVRGPFEKQLAKKLIYVSRSVIFKFFSIKDPFKKDDE
jgi:hypothetical protein